MTEIEIEREEFSEWSVYSDEDNPEDNDARSQKSKATLKLKS